MIWTVVIIAITLTIWFCIAMKVFYDLRINKEFTTKVKDVKAVVNTFRDTYLEGYSKNSKYVGKGSDIHNLIKSLNEILNLNIWNL